MNPLLAVAVGGAAVVAGALVALSFLGGGEDVATRAVSVPPRPSATATATASPEATAGPTAGPGAAGAGSGLFVPNARDPFLALVGGTVPSSTDTSTPGSDATLPAGGTAVGGSTGGDLLGGTGTTGGQSGGSTGSAGGSTGSTGSTGSAGGSGSTTETATQLTRAQVCTAVTDPMNQVEQLLTGSASGATGAVDAGLALRNPVAVLRTAVSLTSDSRLAGRLDIAASTAEALRAQLIAGTAVTSGQVATQVSRDADVRSACA